MPFLESEDDEDDEDDDNDFAEEYLQAFGREDVGPIASPHIVPDFYNRRFLDMVFESRRYVYDR